MKDFGPIRHNLVATQPLELETGRGKFDLVISKGTGARVLVDGYAGIATSRRGGLTQVYGYANVAFASDHGKVIIIGNADNVNAVNSGIVEVKKDPVGDMEDGPQTRTGDVREAIATQGGTIFVENDVRTATAGIFGRIRIGGNAYEVIAIDNSTMEVMGNVKIARASDGADITVFGTVDEQYTEHGGRIITPNAPKS